MSVLPFLIFCASMIIVTARHSVNINEHHICDVKDTCFKCLSLPHCSWCIAQNKCFSQKLVKLKDFCPNGTIEHDSGYGLSLVENADCSCADGKKHLHCYPAGTTAGPECSGHGECRCGHCICDSNPDPTNPTKAFMGEYCEFDNYSCFDYKANEDCNEGPYMSQPDAVVDYGEKTDDIDDVKR